MKIAVYSGSFNPLHKGHEAIIRFLTREAGFDLVYLVVTPQNPFKQSHSLPAGQDRFYGTLKSEVNRIWAKGHVIIFDVDVKGGVSLKKYFGDAALSVFIQAPSVEELRKRLIARKTDTPEAIEERVAKAAEEMTYAPKFDKVLVNDDLETAYREAEELVNNFLNN